jgi:hypothetical protein
MHIAPLLDLIVLGSGSAAAVSPTRAVMQLTRCADA